MTAGAICLLSVGGQRDVMQDARPWFLFQLLQEKRLEPL